jgi:hypothetical protein
VIPPAIDIPIAPREKEIEKNDFWDLETCAKTAELA